MTILWVFSFFFFFSSWFILSGHSYSHPLSNADKNFIPRHGVERHSLHHSYIAPNNYSGWFSDGLNKGTSLLLLKEKKNPTTVCLLWVVYQACFHAAEHLKKIPDWSISAKNIFSLIIANCMQNNFEAVVKVSHQEDNELSYSFEIHILKCILKLCIYLLRLTTE